MRHSSQVKPIGYLNANAAEVLTRLASGGRPWSLRRMETPGRCCGTSPPSKKRRRPWPR
jgi:hypothetical protein